jgi:hypothetical protein
VFDDDLRRHVRDVHSEQAALEVAALQFAEDVPIKIELAPFHKFLELVRHSQMATEPERPRSCVSTGPVSAPALNS